METYAQRFKEKLAHELLSVVQLNVFLTLNGLLLMVLSMLWESNVAFTRAAGILYLILLAAINSFALFWERRERKHAEESDLTQHRWSHPERDSKQDPEA